MSRKCSCFVIGVRQIFKKLNSVPRYKKVGDHWYIA